MTLLSPLSLFWLASVPALVWLWRFASSRHQTRIPSLIPFEHLLRRPPTRRTRVLVNVLFWLQLIALVLLAFALAEPVWQGRRSSTILAVLDTSASMGASGGGASPFQRATRDLLSRIDRQFPPARFLVVTTSPVRLLTPEPTSDAAELHRLIEAVTVADLGGNLSVARRIGQAMLDGDADRTVVLTDEPAPKDLEPTVTFRSFGSAGPNVAIVGVDAYEPLCRAPVGGTGPSATQLTVMAQNFSAHAQRVNVVLRANGRVAARAALRLQAASRTPVSLGLPDGTTGPVEVELRAPKDVLASDNRVWLTLQGTDTRSVAVASDRPAFVDTVGRWLDACPRIAWKPATAGAPDASAADILITDHPALAQSWSFNSAQDHGEQGHPSAGRVEPWPSSVIAFAPPQPAARLLLTHWLANPAHPIGDYLEPLLAVPAALAPVPSAVPGSEVALWAIVQGQKVPLVSAAAHGGRRAVTIALDPVQTPNASPVILAFLNSLRWLTASRGLITTGESLTVGPFAPGHVRVERPRGGDDLVAPSGGLVRYDATDQAGRYRFSQGRLHVERAVNFLDPVESDTLHRVSTWGTDAARPAPAHEPGRSPHSLVHWLLGLLVIVLFLEWVMYSRKGRQA